MRGADAFREAIERHRNGERRYGGPRYHMPFPLHRTCAEVVQNIHGTDVIIRPPYDIRDLAASGGKAPATGTGSPDRAPVAGVGGR